MCTYLLSYWLISINIGQDEREKDNIHCKPLYYCTRKMTLPQKPFILYVKDKGPHN